MAALSSIGFVLGAIVQAYCMVVVSGLVFTFGVRRVFFDRTCRYLIDLFDFTDGCSIYAERGKRFELTLPGLSLTVFDSRVYQELP